MKQCIECGKEHDREHRRCSSCSNKRRPAGPRTCPQCGKVHKDRHHARCRVCIAGGQENYLRLKRLERERRASRLGKPALEVRNAVVMRERRQERERAEAERRAAWEAQQVARAARREADAREAKRLGISLSSLKWHRRYTSDPIFRERERLRARDKKLRDQGRMAAQADGSLTPEALATLFASAKRCAYCRRSMRSQDKSLDHVVPISKGGPHSLLNAVVCCKRCNSRKHAGPVESVLPAGAQLPLLMETAA